jgi:predicted nucleic acid-binding protein
VLDADWIDHRELRTEQEIVAFARFAELLVRGDRNRGEAGVLALASTTGGVAVIDDGPGRRAAVDRGIALRPTLALLCEAIRKGLLTVQLVSALADDLLASKYRLPFGPGGFEKWSSENDLLV